MNKGSKFTRMSGRVFVLCILFLAYIHNGVYGKVHKGSFTLKKDEKIHFLTKFSCNIGTCNFHVNMKLKDNLYFKILNYYYNMNEQIHANPLKNYSNDNYLNMDDTNFLDLLRQIKKDQASQRLTLMLDIEQKYVDRHEKCYAYGHLRNVHPFNLPFRFKFSDLVNKKSYEGTKHLVNSKYALTFNNFISELKSKKNMQNDSSKHINLLNNANEYTSNANVDAITTHRVHVWYLIFDDCYDTFVKNLKESIKSKLLYWEYFLRSSENTNITSLADAYANYDSKYTNTDSVNEILLNPKRLPFVENTFSSTEIADLNIFLKHYEITKLSSFKYIYNNIYRNGFFEQALDHIYANEGFTVEYEVNMLQTNSSHFSYELLYSPLLTFIMILLYVFLLYQNRTKILQHITSRQHRHIMVISIAIIIVIQLLANIFLYIHLLVYSKNGTGIESFKITFNLLNFSAQVLMCTLLLSLSYGLTILETDANVHIRIKTIFVSITLFHVVLVILDNTFIKETSSKFFDNDNITGYIIVLMRIILAIIYHINVNNLFTSIQAPQVKGFLKKLYINGIFYILSFPIIFLFCYVYDTYWRQRFMIFGTSFLQYIATYLITRKFLSSSEYFKISDMSASALPGGTSTWFNQKAHNY